MPELDEVVGEFLVESYENLDRLDREFVELETRPDDAARLASIFRTIHTIKGTCGFLGFQKLEKVAHAGESLLAKLRDGALRLDAAITTALLRLVDAVRAILKCIETNGQEGDGDYTELQALLARLCQTVAVPVPVPARVAPPIPTPAADVGPAPAPAPEPAPDAAPDSAHVSAADATIRVDVGLVDSLMNLVGELVLSRNQIVQVASGPGAAGLHAVAQRLDLVTTALQESVMKTRMQPIESVWSRFPRVVRDLSILCGKLARLELTGGDTELDRTIIEAIKDPLTHIVRNAVDHGLERPETRVKSGKPAQGLLRLRAFHEGGQVHIEVADDGGGIDPARVKKKALERGIVGAEQAARMSDRDLLELIFLPGFSTAEQVTNLSGRGVGMDVVKSNIERIGGSVEVESAVGRGTTLRLKIPLTLAIIPALIVTAGGERFAIPQVNLLELVRLEADAARRDLRRIQDVLVLPHRGRLLPLVDLAGLMGKRDEVAPADRDGANLVIVEADGVPFVLRVDAIHDTGEIVVKPLCALLKALDAYAGATIMGDGRVALILDVAGIARRGGVLENARVRAREALAKPVAAVDEVRPLLLFTAGARRMALPLADVARLEEFERSAIEATGGLPVVQCRGEITELAHVAGDATWLAGDGEPRRASDDEPVQAVICHADGRSYGIVVDRILDIVQEPVATTHASAGATDTIVRETAVVQGRVTEIVDVRAVLRRAGVASPAPLAKVGV